MTGSGLTAEVAVLIWGQIRESSESCSDHDQNGVPILVVCFENMEISDLNSEDQLKVRGHLSVVSVKEMEISYQAQLFCYE